MNATDVFSRVMAEAYDQRDHMPAPGGFASIFGNLANGSQIINGSDVEVFTMDIILGSERLAPMIPRNETGRIIEGAKNSEEQRFTTFDRVWPLIETEGDISAGQLLKRVAGESPFVASPARAKRLMSLAGKIRQEDIRKHARTYEYLASQSVITGKMPAILNTTNPALMYDWRRPASNFIQAAADWALPATDILSDIDAACDAIRSTGRLNPDISVLSSVDMDSFVKNTTVKDLADNRRIELIQISETSPMPSKYQRYIDAGFIPRGRLRTPKGYTLYLFTYLDIYDDPNGDPVPYLTANKTVVFSSDARADFGYGPPERMPVTSAELTWYKELFNVDMSVQVLPLNLNTSMWSNLLSMSLHADAYESSKNKKGITIRNQSAPVFATTATGGFATITTKP